MIAWYQNMHYAQSATRLYGDDMPKTEAQKRSTNKYIREKLDAILIRYPKGTKEKIQQLSMLSGESMAGYVLEAIRQRAERDGHADILSGGSAGSDRDGDGETETETDGSAEEYRE